MFQISRFLIVAILVISSFACFNARRTQTDSNVKTQIVTESKQTTQTVTEPKQTPQTTPKEDVQTVFDLEEDVRKEADIPADVIAILKSDESVDACFKLKGENVNEAEWFAASEIDLNGDERKDLVIKAKDACLFGANQGPFWIFQNRPDGFLKILSANGLQLRVLPKKSNSFNEIEVSKVITMKPFSQTYIFKSEKYQIAESFKQVVGQD